MSITLTRQELYDRVWAEPIDKLCKEFGLSNVGLGKACRRHKIPVPPRGYWQRKAAGYADRRPALPKFREGDETMTLLGSRVVNRRPKSKREMSIRSSPSSDKRKTVSSCLMT